MQSEKPVETTDLSSTEHVLAIISKGKSIVSFDIILSEKDNTTAGQIHKIGPEKIR